MLVYFFIYGIRYINSINILKNGKNTSRNSHIKHKWGLFLLWRKKIVEVFEYIREPHKYFETLYPEHVYGSIKSIGFSCPGSGIQYGEPRFTKTEDLEILNKIKPKFKEGN